MPQLKVHTNAQPDLLPAENGSFRAGMRQLAGGVTVIAAGQGTDRAGMTVSSLSSFSIDPPSLIVSINRQASIRPVLDRYKAFGASILNATQGAVADRFAGVGGLKGNSRFIGEQWITLESGAPLLVGALAVFDCEIEDIIERHTHSIVIAQVKAVRASNFGSPLVHWQGQYSNLAVVDTKAAANDWQ